MDFLRQDYEGMKIMFLSEPGDGRHPRARSGSTGRAHGRPHHSGSDDPVVPGHTRDDEEPTDDIPSVNVKFDLRRRLADGRGYAQLGVAVFARDERPGPTEIVTPSYATVDLGAGWRLSESVELRATVRNLFDSAYPASPDRRAVLAPGINAVIAVVGRVLERRVAADLP